MAKREIEKGQWINNKFILRNNREKEKPCHKLKYCPYGQLVEEYPIKKKRNKFACKTFGHNCPMYYQAENITE